MRRLSHKLVSLLTLFLLITPVHANASDFDFSLTSHDNKTFHFQQLHGRVVLVFFGYTSCPDICPFELQHISTTLKNLGDDAELVQGLFISVDPEQDKPEVLKEYLAFFDDRLIGLTGSKTQIDRVTKMFQVSYQKTASTDNGYTVDHSANLFVIDQNGKLDTIVPFGFPAAHIENVVRHLLAQAQ